LVLATQTLDSITWRSTNGGCGGPGDAADG
jgi:hypothetical protein